MKTIDYVVPTMSAEDLKTVKNLYEANVKFLKQKWSKDDMHFSPEVEVSSEMYPTNVQILDFPSRGEVCIRIIDQFGMLCCDHTISADFQFKSTTERIPTGNASYVPQGACSKNISVSWLAQSGDDIFLMCFKVRSNYQDKYKLTSAFTAAKNLAVQYKEKFELQETLRHQLLSESESSDNQSESTEVDEDQSQCSLFEKDQSEELYWEQTIDLSRKKKEKQYKPEESGIVAEMKKLAQCVQEMKNQLDINDNNEKDKEIKRLTSAVEVHLNQLRELHTEVDNKNKKIEEFVSKHKQMQTEVDNKNKKIEEFVLKFQQMQTELDNKNKKNEEFVSKHKQMQTELDNKNKKIEEFVSKHKQMQTELDNKNKKIDEFVSKHKQMQTEVDNKNKKIEEFVSKHKQMQTEVDNKNKKIEEFVSKHKQMQTEVDNKNKKNEEIISKVQQMQTEVDNKNKKIEEFVSKHKQMQTEVDNKNKQIEEFVLKFLQMQTEVENKNKKNEEFVSKHKQMQTEVDNKNKKIEEIISKHKQMQTGVNKKNKENEDLMAQVESLNMQIQDKNCEIQQLKAKNKAKMTKDICLEAVVVTLYLPEHHPNKFKRTWEIELRKQGVPESLWITAVGNKALQNFQRYMFIEGKFNTKISWDQFLDSLGNAYDNKWNLNRYLYY